MAPNSLISGLLDLLYFNRINYLAKATAIDINKLVGDN